MLAQRVLGNQTRGLTTSLERLSTGFRINRGADDPAGLIASENLRSDKAAIGAAIKNAQRAEQVVNVAEGGLQEINNLLVELQGLVGESANNSGLSVEEKEANQLQIDSILQTIDRVANSTTFNGQNLLNGQLDYQIDSTPAGIDNIQVNSAKLSDSGDPLSINVDVVSRAWQGAVGIQTSAITAGSAVSDAGSITIEVVGNNGSQQFTFASGTTGSNIVSAINTFSEATGVVASSIDADGIILRSTEYGEDGFVTAKVLNGSATDSDIISAVNGDQDALTGGGVSQLTGEGINAALLINGQQATTNGLTARVSSDGFDVTVTLDGASALNADNQSASFNITGGGADFSISPKVNLAGRASIGIGSVTSGNLGGVAGALSDLKSGGSSNVVSGNLTKAQEILDQASKQVSGLRGRLGAFQKNTLGATINNLGVTLENTAAAESSIRDTDFASETATLTRQQIISQAATQSLSIANSQPQSVLALLG